MRNDRAGFKLIPEDVITKPPSAELRPDQRDDQSLPPYDVLDEVLRQYVEQDRAPQPSSSPRRASTADLVRTHCPASSTWPSTSAARPRPARGSRPRPSARTAASRSPTAIRADPRHPHGGSRSIRPAVDKYDHGPGRSGGHERPGPGPVAVALVQPAARKGWIRRPVARPQHCAIDRSGGDRAPACTSALADRRGLRAAGSTHIEMRSRTSGSPSGVAIPTKADRPHRRRSRRRRWPTRGKPS